MIKNRQIRIVVVILLTGIILHVPHIPGQMIVSSENPISPTDEDIIRAAEYLYAHQDESGQIQGLATSSWAAMALSIIDRNDSRFQKLIHYLVTSTSQLDFEKPTDIERHILSLVACDINPENTNSINLTKKLLDLYDGIQIGDPSNIYDDIFGVLALISTGVSKNSSVLTQLKQNIISDQHDDGSWGDVDTTVIAIMALVCSGVSNQSTIFDQSIHYLQSKQDQSGGFSSWGSVNIASTSWTVSALASLDINPCSNEWKIGNKTPITYILSLQQSDGSFNYTKTQSMNPLWMTSYALIALCGNCLPVRIQKITPNIDPDDSDDEVDNQNGTSDPSFPPEDEINTVDKVINRGIRILHPQDQGIYFMNKRTRFYLDALVVIGPVDLIVAVNNPVDKVVFYMNDICIGVDCSPPFSISIDKRFHLGRNTITVQAIRYNQSFYQIDTASLIQQIINNVKSYLCEQDKEYYQNLSEMKYEMDQNYIDRIYQTTISMIMINMSILSTNIPN